MALDVSQSERRCDGISRRGFLHLGILGSLGFSLADLFRLGAVESTPHPKAQSCILIWLDGGPSHLDTFDPKPDAPSEVRSVFRAIPSTVSGINICEHLPRTAKVMHEVALIRSLTHELGNHDTGTRFMLTGNRPVASLEYPSLGSILARETDSRSALPSYVAIPNDGVGGNSNAARAGFLANSYSPFNAGDDPARVRDLHPPEGVSFLRSERRRGMLMKIDAFTRAIEGNSNNDDRDAFYEQAYRLIASPEAKAAFDLSGENTATRDLYGRSRVGSGCLLARRLIEAGSRFLTVVDTGWDMHNQIFRELPDSRFPGSGKLPSLDRAYAGLISDLRQRGLLDSTLVVMMGEFGRTPKLNALGGRDHWPRAGFVCMSGGGVRGAQVIGATDAHGEAPSERPVSPDDVAFSILRMLGVDPTKEVATPSGRPVRYLKTGAFISELV